MMCLRNAGRIKIDIWILYKVMVDTTQYYNQQTVVPQLLNSHI